MPVDHDDDDIFDVPTVYLPPSVTEDPWDTRGTLNTNAYLNTPGEWAPGAASDYRVSLYLINASSTYIDIMQVYTAHGFQTGRPIVYQPDGVRWHPKPDGLASTSDDWIDAPPKGFGSLGVYTFDPHSPSFVGVKYGVKFRCHGQHVAVASGITQDDDHGWRWTASDVSLEDWTDDLDRDQSGDESRGETGNTYGPIGIDYFFTPSRALFLLRDAPTD